MPLERRTRERRSYSAGPPSAGERRRRPRRLTDREGTQLAPLQAHVERLFAELERLKEELERARYRLSEATRAIRKSRRVGRHK
jgi:predicted RNase H-like nuclease (RuvC/YqgF family)